MGIGRSCSGLANTNAPLCPTEVLPPSMRKAAPRGWGHWHFALARVPHHVPDPISDSLWSPCCNEETEEERFFHQTGVVLCRSLRQAR